MSKYIMKDGAFFNKEANESVATITGTLAGIRVIENEDGNKKLQLDFKHENEGGETVIDTLTLRLYREPALKVLRALFGILEILGGKVITLSMEQREGRQALLTVSADGETLSPRNCGESFAYEERIFIDKAVRIIKAVLGYSKTVLVYSNADKDYPQGGDEIEAITTYIRELRSLGRTGELNVKKVTFNVASAAKGYLQALRDLQPTRAFRVFVDEEAINAIWTAFTEELPETPSSEMTSSGTIVDEDDNEY